MVGGVGAEGGVVDAWVGVGDGGGAGGTRGRGVGEVGGDVRGVARLMLLDSWFDSCWMDGWMVLESRLWGV